MKVRAEVSISTTISLVGDELYEMTEALRVILNTEQEGKPDSLSAQRATNLLVAMVEAHDKREELASKLRMAGIPESL